MTDAIKQIVKYRGNTKIVLFEDTRLAASVERLQQEDPPRLAWVNLDAPPGTYEVESRTTMPGGCWEVRLNPDNGQHVGFHNCPARAENPRANVPCIHVAAAYLCWKAQRDAEDPYLRRVAAFQEQEVSDEQSPSTALAPYHGDAQLTTYHVPSRQEISDTLALGKVLMETRGAAIPQALDTPQKAAAVILAGRELGFDVMASFRHFFVVDGQTQPDGQALVALMQRGGADIIYHCDCDQCADVELIRPGRTPIRIKYTLEQARKAGSTGGKRKDGSVWEKPAWKNHPADMLIWKAVARLARRGAADLVNSVQSAMVRVEDFEDHARQLDPGAVQEAVWQEQREQRPALVDHETGEVLDEAGSGEPGANADDDTEDGERPAPPQDVDDEEGTADPPPAEAAPGSPEPDPRDLTYAEAHRDKGKHFKALTDFQKAVKGKGALPDGYETMSLSELVEAMGGTWPS